MMAINGDGDGAMGGMGIMGMVVMTINIIRRLLIAIMSGFD